MTLELTDKLQRLVNIAGNARGTRQTARLALDCFDLTSLRGDEEKEEIYDLCDIARHNHLASVCVYPDQIRNAKAVLKDGPVRIATVINFPTGRMRTLSDIAATPETIRLDVAEALHHGARQIDIVLPLDYFREGTAASLNEVKAMLRACRVACGKDVTMKVIFETAAFDNAVDLRQACKIAIGQKTDCLKTSTGKHPAGGATMEAAAILMDEAQKASHHVGCKISGGVKTNDDCARYMTLNEGIRGRNSIRPEFFRIGASSLLDQLLPVLGTHNHLKSAPEYNY